MADTKDTKNDPKNQVLKADGLPAPLAAPVGKDIMYLATNVPVYRPDHCSEYGIQGWLLGVHEMPPVGGEREWKCFVFRATHPTIGMDRDGKKIAVMVGEEVWLPVTHVLENDPILKAIANHPTKTQEVFIKPTKKIAIGGGQTLWQFQSAVIGDIRNRTDHEKLLVAQTAAANPQLAAGAANGAGAAIPPPF